MIFIILQALFSERSMPSPLKDVSYLSMHIGSLDDDLVPEMVSLLSGMANLNTLRINTYPSYLLDKPKVNESMWLPFSQKSIVVGQYEMLFPELMV